MIMLDSYIVDNAGNVAISPDGLTLLARIEALAIPLFASTEQAVEWGSHLNPEQHTTLVDMQRTASNAALGEHNLQRMVNLATQSQLMREAAETFPSQLLAPSTSARPLLAGLEK
jgi:hypothetical protein